MEIDGGAVEASWVIHSPEGRAISSCACADPAIAAVRFHLVGTSAEVAGQRPCDGRSSCAFACQRQTGATPFDIPPGTYSMSLVPVDAEGRDLTQPAVGRGVIEAPAPILRDVVRGQPTQLSAHLQVAACAASCAGADENSVCAAR